MDATGRVRDLLAQLDADEARRCLERAISELAADADRDVFGRRVNRPNLEDDALLELLAAKSAHEARSPFELAKTWPTRPSKAGLAATLGDEPSHRMTLPNIPPPAQMRMDPERHHTPSDSALIRSATGRDWRPMLFGGGLGAVVILLIALAFGGEPSPPRTAPVIAPAAPAEASSPPEPAPTGPPASSPKPLPAPQRARRAATRKPTAPVDEVFGSWK
jgi:hypothetical protein